MTILPSKNNDAPSGDENKKPHALSFVILEGAYLKRPIGSILKSLNHQFVEIFLWILSFIFVFLRQISLQDDERREMKLNNKAFSLIELSISLTIISLLIGSVLVGKRIRDNTILHSIMDDMNKLSFAYSGFKSMYLEAPGDFDNATNQFTSSVVTVANGNNNGYIDNNSAENSLALQHLSLAGYIQGSFCGSWTSSTTCLTYMQSRALKGGDGYYFASTSSTAGGTFSVFDNNTNSSYQNIIVYAKLYKTTGSYTWLTNTTYSALTPLEMYNIDNKYDDGNPTTGNVIAASGVDVTNGCVVSGAYINSNTAGCYFATIVK